jgi:hypothetical protein
MGSTPVEEEPLLGALFTTILYTILINTAGMSRNFNPFIRYSRSREDHKSNDIVPAAQPRLVGVSQASLRDAVHPLVAIMPRLKEAVFHQRHAAAGDPGKLLQNRSWRGPSALTLLPLPFLGQRAISANLRMFPPIKC